MMIGDLEGRMDGVLPRLGVGGVFGDGRGVGGGLGEG